MIGTVHAALRRRPLPVEEEDFLIKLTGKRVSATGFRIKMERKWKKYLLLYFIPTGSNPLISKQQKPNFREKGSGRYC